MTKYNSPRLGNKEIIFDRINVFLGANGTGKSKLLEEIRNSATTAFSVTQKNLIYVEGGRTIKITGSLKLTRQNFEQYQTTQTTEDTRTNKLQQGIADRIQDSLILLDRKGQELKSKHSDEVDLWTKNNYEGNCPLRKEPPLDVLIDLFHEIFPQLVLEFDETTKQIRCSKNGSPKFTPNTLSEGEKQVFSLLADILLLTEKKSVIIVDEPELNLNPKLACKVWDTIENELTDSIFIYATHSVSFTMRKNVNKIYVLSSENENFQEISNMGEIHQSDFRELLGTIPTILSSSRVLFTEGNDSSFDSIFYRWLACEHEGFEVLPIGSSNDVKATTSRIGIWSKIAQNINLKGIIDKDFKQQEELTQLSNSDLTILDYHEAESFLCHPELVEVIAKKLNLVENVPCKQTINDLIFSHLEKKKVYIVAQQVTRKTSIQASISIDKKSMQDVENFEDLETQLITKSSQQQETVKEKIGSEKIKELISDSRIELERIISEKDVDAALSILPGKELLNEISNLTGCKSPLSFLRAVSKNIEINDYPHLKKISDKLIQMLN